MPKPDPELEAKVLQEAAAYDGTIERRAGWSSELKTVVIMLSVGLVMNGIGLFAMWLTNYYDARRDAREVVQIDCNSRQAIEDALNQLYQQNGRDYRIDIRCDRDRKVTR